MLEHPSQLAVHRDLKVRPIGKHGKCRPELRSRIIDVDPCGEGVRLREPASFL